MARRSSPAAYLGRVSRRHEYPTGAHQDLLWPRQPHRRVPWHIRACSDARLDKRSTSIKRCWVTCHSQRTPARSGWCSLQRAIWRYSLQRCSYGIHTRSFRCVGECARRVCDSNSHRWRYDRHRCHQSQPVEFETTSHRFACLTDPTSERHCRSTKAIGACWVEASRLEVQPPEDDMNPASTLSEGGGGGNHTV
jgi:hypothetical protein